MLVDLSHVAATDDARRARRHGGPGGLQPLQRPGRRGPPAQRPRRRPAPPAGQRRRVHGDLRAEVRQPGRRRSGRPRSTTPRSTRASTRATWRPSRRSATRYPRPCPPATLADVVAHVEHVREVAGHRTTSGSVATSTARPRPPVGLEDVSRYPALLDALRERGWSEPDLVALTHGNVRRVLARCRGGRRRPAGGPRTVGRHDRGAGRCSGARPAGARPVADDRRGTGVSGLLEVVVTHAPDAERAEAGGADRVSLVGDPTPARA